MEGQPEAGSGDGATVREEPRRLGQQTEDADLQPPPGPGPEDPGGDVNAGVLQVSLDGVPVGQDFFPRVRGGVVPFGVVVPLAEARFFVVDAAAVDVRVAVLRCARLGACAFPSDCQKVSAISKSWACHISAVCPMNFNAGADAPSAISWS